jgi:predicted nucleic acid-binding protein
LDACVLFPQTLRDLLLSLAGAGLFRARWSERINQEWVQELLLKNPGRRLQVLRTLELVNESVEDCLVTGYEHLIESIVMPDPHDRHAVAAAVAGGADVIVTFNLADFPADVLSPLGLEAKHPDDFLASIINVDGGAACEAIKAMRERYKKPPMTAGDFIASINAKGLVKTALLLLTTVDQI